MADKIVDILVKTLDEESLKRQNDATIQAFQKISSDFEKLVKSGFATKRGYNLMGIDNEQQHCSTFRTGLFMQTPTRYFTST